jgi:hypothetical protein
MKQIKLEVITTKRVSAIKAVRVILDCGLKYAKQVSEGMPLYMRDVPLSMFSELLECPYIKVHVVGVSLPSHSVERQIVIKLLWHKERTAALYTQLAEIKGLTP